MMAKIIFLQGLPGSGKSFRAKDMVSKHPGKYKRVSKDDLRMQLDNGVRSRHNEKFVIKIRDEIIIHSLRDGFDVIVDDTNFATIHEERMNEILDDLGRDKYSMEKKFFDTPLEICIERDAKRDNPVGRKVIEDMYNQYLKKERKERKMGDMASMCVIFDIDGTLARKGDRDIYDYTKVGLDTPINQTRFMINLIHECSFDIILTTGRMDACRKETERRLEDNHIPYDYLYMRKTDDVRKDAIIKEEIYREHIEPRYNVFAVFDDRPQVIEKRRSLGLYVFDCNQGGKNF